MDALILAGGENRRFSSHKALAEVDGKRLIETIVELFKKYFKRVYISTNTPEVFFYLGLPMIGDVITQRGPMAGIYSAFVSSGSEALFVSACDMPFIRPGLVELMRGRFSGQDALVPLCKGKPEPLLAIYSGRAVEKMRDQIMHNKMALWDLLHLINTEYINEEDLDHIDPERKSFVNINTLDEYREITARI